MHGFSSILASNDPSVNYAYGRSGMGKVLPTVVFEPKSDVHFSFKKKNSA